MTTETRPRLKIVLLDGTEEGRVKVLPRDGEEYVVTMQQAVEACGVHGDQLRCADQFKELCATLGQWIQPRIKAIKTAHVTTRGKGILFLVMQREVEFDQELTDELIELDLTIAHDERFDQIEFEVLPVPAVSERSLSAFLATAGGMEYAE